MGSTGHHRGAGRTPRSNTCIRTSTGFGVFGGKAASVVTEQGLTWHLPDSPRTTHAGTPLPEPRRRGGIAHLGVAWPGFTGLSVPGDRQEEPGAAARPDKSATAPRARPSAHPLREEGRARAETPSRGWKPWRSSAAKGSRALKRTGSRRERCPRRHSITESQNSRGWQGPLWVTQPNPLPKQGHLQQATQDLVQAGLEYLQRRRLHNLPGQPVPVLRHPQREEVLPHVQLELPRLQFVPIGPCPVTGHH